MLWCEISIGSAMNQCHLDRPLNQNKFTLATDPWFVTWHWVKLLTLMATNKNVSHFAPTSIGGAWLQTTAFKHLNLQRKRKNNQKSDGMHQIFCSHTDHVKMQSKLNVYSNGCYVGRIWEYKTYQQKYNGDKEHYTMRCTDDKKRKFRWYRIDSKTGSYWKMQELLLHVFLIN